MPELPEVETTSALIRPHVEGRRIEGSRVSWERTLGGATPAAFDRAVRGATVARVGRRAKWVVMDLERLGRPAGALLCHLRMSGRLVVDEGGADGADFERVDGSDFERAASSDFERVALRLAGPDPARRWLRFLDVRKFGRLRFVEDPRAALAGLGPEPLGPAFTADWLRTALRARRRILKPLLLDQEFLAGLGNIYVDESLFLAGLHPLRRSDRIGRDGALRLHGAIQSVLREAIAREGSSFDTFYRTPEGQPGAYQHQFQVYARDGQPCRRCGRTIRKLVVGQRGTHVCTRCQPAPRARRVDTLRRP